MAINAIYSPQMLWSDFDDGLPLKETIVKEDVCENVIYRDIRFSGRAVGSERVSVFATYAFSKQVSKKNQKKGAILIIPDYDQTISRDIMNLYLKQGYNVLMVDYRGEAECENFTVYPDRVSYANYYNSGDKLDTCNQTAVETPWYEWVAVMKYALSFLKSQPEIAQIGVLGIKNGSNLGWMLCGSDNRVSCFVSLFGAGWRAYKNKFKNAESGEFEMTEERMRFLAGVESQAYAKNVACPVLFMTATNSAEFDIDRSVDTLIRVPDNGQPVERINNYSPRLRNVLDKCSARNIDIFFARYLLGFKTSFPDEPKLDLRVEDINGNGEEKDKKPKNYNQVTKKRLLGDLQISFSDTKRAKRVEVYVSEGVENPAYRDWNLMTEIKGKSEINKKFTYNLNANATFVSAFALVEYKNGITICSKLQSKKVDITTNRFNNLLYSSKEKTGSFTVYDVRKYSSCGLFFNDDDYLFLTEGANNISGISSRYGLVSYRVNNTYVKLSERSIIKMDVFCMENSTINLSLILVDLNGKSTEYTVKLTLKGGKVWQNIMFKCTDFKSTTGIGIKDYSLISALKIESESMCIVNNILLI